MDDKDSILSDILEQPVESNYFQRLFYGIIDTVVYIVFMVLIIKFLPVEVTSRLVGGFKTYVTVIIIMVGYRTICLLTLGRTLGMILCKLKYLNDKHKPLSLKEKFVAVLAFRTSSIKNYKD